MKSKYVIAVCLVLSLMAGCTRHNEVPITSLQQLNDSRYTIGYGEGHSAYTAIKELLPNAKLHSFNSHIIGFEAARLGKIDGYAYDRLQLELAIDNGLSGVRLLDENLGDPIDIAVGLSPVSKIPDLEKKINAFLAEIKADGTFKEIENRWLNEGNDTMPDIPEASEPKYHLTVGTTAEVPPYSYYKGTMLTGMDIELAKRFALWLGADLEFKIYDFNGIIAAALAGDIDCIMANLNITKERKEKIAFSDPFFSMANTIMVRDSGQKSDGSGMWKRLSSSFEKTFVREARWKLIAKGIGVTIIISTLAALFGTLLGFGICALRMSGNRLLNGVALGYIRIMQGTPIVVLLMILFYVVFAKTGLSSILVAVIGFGMNFGAYVSEMIRTGILAVDKGQMEAALALGYPKFRAFNKIVLPQAAQYFLPVFQGEFISMVKMTSVVGYIAIQDLTKAGDIIKSRTFEAFFPLVVIAVIYFIIAWILTRILVALQNHFDPKRRREKRQ